MRAAAVRRATPPEWRAYRHLRLAALADAPDAFGSTLADAIRNTEADWRRRLEDAACFIAGVDGRDAGLAAGIVDGGRAELVSMWIDPRHRGAGLADLLVDAVVGWARAAGFDELRLWVADGNERARRLYLRHGFALTADAQPVRDDTPDRLEHGMVLRLRPAG